MLGFLWRRLVYTLPIMLGVALVCFALVHLAPGDPLVSILPPDASAELQAKMKELYGFNRSYPEQFVSWVWRVRCKAIWAPRSPATGRCSAR